MPKSSTHSRIWGDVEQFDTGKAVVEVTFYYLVFVVLAGFVNTAILSQILIAFGVPDEFQWGGFIGFGIPLVAALVVGFRAGVNGTKGLHLHRISAERGPGLMNLAEGLCLTMGIDMPRILELREPQINVAAFAVGNKRSILVVTSGALEAFSRLEFEAVIARELARVRSGQIFFEARVRALQKLVSPIFTFVIPKKQNEELSDQLIAGDLAGVYFTRYPLAMVAALEKMANDPHWKVPGSNLRRRVLAPYWAHPELAGADLKARISELNSF